APASASIYTLSLHDALPILHGQRADFTLTFRRLAGVVRGDDKPFLDLYADREAARAWLGDYLARLASEPRDAAATAQAMDRVNPLYVLRNHLAEQAIRAAAEGDAGEIDRLLALLREPYREHPGAERYAGLPPDWAGGLSVSCSS